MNTTTLSEIWPIIVSAIFFIAWLIRLEAKVLYLEKEQKQYQKIWDKIDSIQTSLSEILQSIAKVEGKLEVKDR